jgi:hypothetical protein
MGLRRAEWLCEPENFPSIARNFTVFIEFGVIDGRNSGPMAVLRFGGGRGRELFPFRANKKASEVPYSAPPALF